MKGGNIKREAREKQKNKKKNKKERRETGWKKTKKVELKGENLGVSRTGEDCCYFLC